MKARKADDTRSTGIMMFAVEYFASAVAVHESFAEKPQWIPGSPKNPVHISSSVAYFLLGHAIELCLKAVLVHCDATVQDHCFRQLGHDLAKCQQAVSARCPDFLSIWDAGDVKSVSLLNDVYMKKEFEYIRTGMTRRVDWNAVQTAAARLFRAASDVVPYSANFFKGRHGQLLQPIMESL